MSTLVSIGITDIIIIIITVTLPVCLPACIDPLRTVGLDFIFKSIPKAYAIGIDLKKKTLLFQLFNKGCIYIFRYVIPKHLFLINFGLL